MMGAYDRAAIRDAKAERSMRLSELRQRIALNDETYAEWRDLQINAVEDDELSLASSIGDSMRQLREQTEDLWRQFRAIAGPAKSAA